MIVLFHVLFYFGKYIYEKLNEVSRKKPALCINDWENNQNTLVEHNHNLDDNFYDDNDIAKIIKFSPPAYIQRYNAISNILRSPKYRGKIHKVVDFGCSELGFFNHLKNTPEIHEIICIDIDGEILDRNKKKISPLTTDYLNMKNHPLNVYIFEGNIIHPDKHLENTDAVICIELIEHLHAETLNAVPKNIFEFIKPQLAIFTTPNVEFNVLFPNMKGFRHDDHKFEWTRIEFENWANDIINKYPYYDVTFEGICPGPSGTAKYGCCTQMAIFNRRDNITLNTTLSADNFYKLIAHVEYPFHVDNRPIEVKILNEASYFIRRYQLNNDCNEDLMPLEVLIKIMDNSTITIEEFRNILSNGGYEIIENENQALSIVLPPLSVYSGVTNDSKVSLNDWMQSSSSTEYNGINKILMDDIEMNDELNLNIYHGDDCDDQDNDDYDYDYDCDCDDHDNDDCDCDCDFDDDSDVDNNLINNEIAQLIRI